MSEIVTKSEFSRRVGLTRQRITQLVHLGLPVRADGKLDCDKAKAWLDANAAPWRGGWGSGMRRSERPAVFDDSEQVYTRADIRNAIRHGIEYTLNTLRLPVNLESVAAAVLNLGGDMKLAWATAEWFEMFLVFNYNPGDSDRPWIKQHKAVGWERFARERGLAVNVDEWQLWWKQALGLCRRAKQKKPVIE